jgi:hypothetical protein
MLRWRTGHEESLETARAYLDEVIGEVVGQYEEFELIASDVQVLPRRAGGNPPQESVEEIEEFYGIAYPIDAPRHPWDEGKWIFPNDHPMAQYERAAHKYENTPEKREAFLEMGRLALPAPNLVEGDDNP